MFDHTIGAVLVGGASSRMGAPKSDLEYLGVPFVDHARATLGMVLDEVVTVGAATGGPHDVEDAVPGTGPLGGILAALEYADGLPVMVLAVDLPLVSIELVRRLVDPPVNDPVVRAAFDGERLQPLCAVWGPGLAEPVSAYLANGRRSVMDFVEGVPYERIGTDAYLLTNVNTPADYAALHGSTDQ